MTPVWIVLADIDWNWVFHADRFVGTVSGMTGLALLLAAIFNWKKFFHSKRPAWFVSSFGPVRSRIIFALLGLFLIALGVAIAVGWTAS